MLRTNDGTQYKRLSGRSGDKQPSTLGFKRNRANYTATGGETTINLSSLSPQISYMPGQNQLMVKRSSGGVLILAAGDYYELTPNSIGFPVSDPLVTGEIVEITQEFSVTGVYAVTPSPSCYTTVATASQTLITANFSWQYNLNPSAGIGAVSVYINGILQTRGVDYTEVNLGLVNTNQVLLTVALLGYENVILLPTYQAIDTSAAASNFNGQALAGIQNLLQVGTQGFIDQSATIPVPNTTIVGRAKIPDITNDMRASLGIERIQTQQIMLLQNEAGANGELVYSVVNDDRGLIRFVGSGWSSANGANGATILSNVIGNYVEIVFYGTGLNLLGLPHTTTHVIQAYVDGVLTVSNIYSSVAYSSVIYSRNYAANSVVPVVSGLTLGIHTIKLVQNDGVANLYVPGFEVLNANASGLININPGIGYINGQKYTNYLIDSNSYNPLPTTWYTFTCTAANATVGATYRNNSQTFTVLYTISLGTTLVCAGTGAPSAASTLTLLTGVGDNTITYSGTPSSTMQKGLRVVQYINSDGTAGNSWTPVAASSSTLTNANHTNEEVARVFHWREFGAGRASDDFTTLTSVSDRAFTLDDGVTTLVGYQVLGTVGETFAHNAANSFWTLTFVGTGLDVVLSAQFASVTTTYDIIIDGTTVASAQPGTIFSTSAGTNKICKIVSGLAYGTHAVGIKLNTVVSGQIRFFQFIVYQPKTPTLPTTALQTAAYNVMTTYIASSSAAQGTIAPGVLRKMNIREFIYTGTMVSPVLNSGQMSGFTVSSITSGSTAQYTFFGSAVEISMQVANTATNTRVFINGSNVLSGYTTSFLQTSTGLTWTAATGDITGTSAANARTRICISGLPLGINTVKLAQNTTTDTFYIEGVDIVTPIHSYKSNLYADIQNTLTVGSNSLMDTRATTYISQALPAQKAWVQAVGITPNPTTTSTALVPVPDLSCSVKTSGSPLQISFSITGMGNASVYIKFQIYVDGLPVGPLLLGLSSTYVTISETIITSVSAGYHRVDLYWTNNTAQTLTADQRVLTVREL
jgi:hypothetical protein